MQIIKYTLLNGTQVLILKTDRGILCYQRWRNNPWKPINAIALRFIKLGGVTTRVTYMQPC
jgi:hypothetical protein